MNEELDKIITSLTKQKILCKILQIVHRKMNEFDSLNIIVQWLNNGEMEVLRLFTGEINIQTLIKEGDILLKAFSDTITNYYIPFDHHIKYSEEGNFFLMKKEYLLRTIDDPVIIVDDVDYLKGYPLKEEEKEKEKKR